MQRELSLYTNTKTKANISIAVSPSALHNNTSFPTLADYSGCMAVRYMQTMSKKERVANRNAQTEGKVPVVFSSPIYWLRIPRSEARSQAMYVLHKSNLQACMHLARVAGNKASSTHGLQASF
jgi:hypothetical protein